MNKIILIVSAVAGLAVQGAYTNAVERAQRIVDSGCYADLDGYAIAPGDLSAVDDILSAGWSSVTNDPAFYCRNLPLTNRAAINGYRDRCPGFVAWAEACDCGPLWFGWNAKSDDAEKFVNSIDGFLWVRSNGQKPAAYCDLRVFKQRVVFAAQKGLKRYLRSQGISFVIREGHNPVQERIDALSAALDAPRFAGLKAALADCGLDLTCNPSWWIPPQTEIDALKSAILNGERDFDSDAKMILTCALGVSGFNAFVRTYNGD